MYALAFWRVISIKPDGGSGVGCHFFFPPPIWGRWKRCDQTVGNRLEGRSAVVDEVYQWLDSGVISVAKTQGALSGLWDPEKSLCKPARGGSSCSQVFPSLQLSFRLEVFQTFCASLSVSTPLSHGSGQSQKAWNGFSAVSHWRPGHFQLCAIGNCLTPAPSGMFLFSRWFLSASRLIPHLASLCGSHMYAVCQFRLYRWSSNFTVSQSFLKSLLKHRWLDLSPGVSNSLQKLNICICCKLSGNTDTAGLGTVLSEQLPCLAMPLEKTSLTNHSSKISVSCNSEALLLTAVLLGSGHESLRLSLPKCRWSWEQGHSKLVYDIISLVSSSFWA